MKKIMFSDRVLLTQAVLEGRKTQTRRIEKGLKYYSPADPIWVNSRYQAGELVAIAQSYKDTYDYMTGHLNDLGIIRRFARKLISDNYRDHKGWGNKMFVKPDLMPHQVRITRVRLQRLQEITDEECLLEGIEKEERTDGEYNYIFFDSLRELYIRERTPRDAYARLIDALSGKGTWDSNPYVFAYDFDLVK